LIAFSVHFQNCRTLVIEVAQCHDGDPFPAIKFFVTIAQYIFLAMMTARVTGFSSL